MGDDEWNSSGGGWNANAAAASWESNEANGAGEWRKEDTQSNMDDGNHGSAENDSGGCFNCGDPSHMKAECPNPRVFKGTCNGCGEEGHQARDCPNKPKICKNCSENGHSAEECKNNRLLDRSKVPDVSLDQAWRQLLEASNDVDIGDFKEGMEALCKACPNMTYRELEMEFRRRGFAIFLVALKKEIHPSLTNVDLQGKTGRMYTVGYFTSPECQRPAMLPLWPKDHADNLSRLENAGEPMPSHVNLCRSCGKPGHTKNECTEGEIHEPTKVICALCNEEGHRVRDCQNRKVREPRTCKICGSEEHLAKECDQKPERPPMVCRNCNEEGHKASECEKPRVMRCFNCDGEHPAKECTKPKDWSRVTCTHCGEVGHASATRCKVPPAEGVVRKDIGKTDERDSEWDSAGGINQAGGGHAGQPEWETAEPGGKAVSSSAW